MGTSTLLGFSVYIHIRYRWKHLKAQTTSSSKYSQTAVEMQNKMYVCLDSTKNISYNDIRKEIKTNGNIILTDAGAWGANNKTRRQRKSVQSPHQKHLYSHSPNLHPLWNFFLFRPTESFSRRGGRIFWHKNQFVTASYRPRREVCVCV